MTTLTQNLPEGNEWGGRVRSFRYTLAYDSQGTGTIAIGRIPPGQKFLFGVLTTDTSTDTATLAVGISGSTGKYKAAAAHTTTNTPALFGPVAAMIAADTTSEVGSSPLGEGTNEDVILTVGAAALPASGNLVIDLFFAGV